MTNNQAVAHKSWMAISTILVGCSWLVAVKIALKFSQKADVGL